MVWPRAPAAAAALAVSAGAIFPGADLGGAEDGAQWALEAHNFVRLVQPGGDAGGPCVHLLPDDTMQPIVPPERQGPWSITFEACVAGCARAADCRAAEFAGPTDAAGVGSCAHINLCSPGPCLPVAADPAAPSGSTTECYRAPFPSPAPTPAPSLDCDHFCCMQTDRAPCCAGSSCAVGVEGGPCIWHRSGTCRRNSYNRGGGCTAITLTFAQVGGPFNPQALGAAGAEVANEAAGLIGGPAGAVVAAEATQSYDAAADRLTVHFKCDDCGTPADIALGLCWNGRAAHGAAAAREGLSGGCLKVDGNLSLAQPADDLGGFPYLERVEVSRCLCRPVLMNSTLAWNETAQLWEPEPLPHTMQLIAGPSYSPAWADSPPVNELCNVPREMQGFWQFHMGHAAPFGRQFRLWCPPDCGTCDVYLMHYQQPPCSSDVNGDWPLLLHDHGWVARSCAPCMRDANGTQWPMVAYRKQLDGGTGLITPPVGTSQLKYFSVLAGRGANCFANDITNDTECAAAGPTCTWKPGSGSCVDEWCPPRPRAPGPWGPHEVECAPGADPDAGLPSGEALDAALALLPRNGSGF